MSINWGLVAPLIAIQFILMVTALVGCIRAERTNGPKWMWALIIIFISLIGPVLFFTVGRRND
ncbi:PLD nuclease N-terminal domain-containing protein [Paenibacillus sp. MBLB4367]|uniref:PLD nuclease N-terminal domain-containing protein n=1 Tax=Paenibacillus sp. MBLB4367 TaxID=3384767 RepID=UPI0039080841